MNIPILNTLFRWYGKKPVIIVLTLVVVLIISGLLFKSTHSDNAAEALVLPTAVIATAGSFSGDAAVELIGTVAAVSEATVQSEAAGRVTAVYADIGDVVSAGTILVELENSAARAAVVQAEGSYESALAAAASSEVSESAAENNLLAAKDAALNQFRAAYNTSNNILLTKIDQLFSDPTANTPGVLIEVGLQSAYLNQERVALRTEFKTWQQETVALNNASDLPVALETASTRTKRLIGMIDVFSNELVDEDPDQRFSQSDLDNLQADLVAARATLTSVLQSLDAAVTNLTSAEKALNQAQIAGTQSTVSTAEAQVKQAYGALLSARSALAKTIIRSPIAGTVNSISVNVGDFLTSFSTVAFLTNEDAVEVTTYVNEAERAALSVGTPVLLDGQIEGVVTRIAPAVNPITKKIEVKIGTDANNLGSGDTVRIVLKKALSLDTADELFIPITAVKFTEADGYVFTVTDNTLMANPVEIGRIRGSFVEILSGLESTTEILVDARGRAAGQKVEPITR